MSKMGKETRPRGSGLEGLHEGNPECQKYLHLRECKNHAVAYASFPINEPIQFLQFCNNHLSPPSIPLVHSVG